MVRSKRVPKNTHTHKTEFSPTQRARFADPPRHRQRARAHRRRPCGRAARAYPRSAAAARYRLEPEDWPRACRTPGAHARSMRVLRTALGSLARLDWWDGRGVVGDAVVGDAQVVI